MKAAKPLKGLEWRGGAIGNAVWSGALLRYPHLTSSRTSLVNLIWNLT